MSPNADTDTAAERAGNDAKLLPLLTSADAVQRDAALAELVAGAGRIVDRLTRKAQLRSGFAREDIDDLRSTIIVRLVQRLTTLTDDPGAEPMASFDDFVAAMVFHAINDLMRKRYPERAALKNRIRYALDNDPRLAMRGSEHGIIASLASWPADEPLAAMTPTTALGIAHDETARTADAVHALLAAVGGPVALDDLVRLAEERWQTVRATAAPAIVLEDVADPAPGASRRIEARQSLARLWSEILQLPHPQRVALLLGMRESHGVSAIPMLVFSGIATTAGIAEALGMTRAQLEALWGDLPFDDDTIRQRLGVTRQQVTSLRKTARERLARRREKERF